MPDDWPTVLTILRAFQVINSKPILPPLHSTTHAPNYFLFARNPTCIGVSLNGILHAWDVTYLLLILLQQTHQHHLG